MHKYDYGSIPFVVCRLDGYVDFGYAAEAWVVNFYKWLQRVERPQFDRALGLLLGYSVKSIQYFDNKIDLEMGN